ncbi:holin family protein [Paracoccus aerodenitrificans]|uniref:holin family protein n=1 Tax=Paracoccus aerodenitrificans TaxID=3017781 RepID=UPI0022F09291|nr:holin family protein [Paracoccus aerodenitrificans]WBU65536.1 holin family protein [Paracoccus aerodenitrificans]
MGMIDRLIGIGPAARGLSDAATDVAEVFRENATRRMELDEDAYRHAIEQFKAEFGGGQSRFHDFVNGLNRLPRPLMTFGTLGLFGYAMTEPAGFSRRMEGLQTVPEPLWWLLGAIVSFYFGAREAHYFRNRRLSEQKNPRIFRQDSADLRFAGPSEPEPEMFADNAALQDWAKEKQGFVAVS